MSVYFRDDVHNVKDVFIADTLVVLVSFLPLN